MEYSRELGTLKSFEQHWQETLLKRRTTRSRTAVALVLEKYQGTSSFPRTGGDLPNRLRNAAQKQAFRSVLGYWCCFLVFTFLVFSFMA